MKHMCDIVLVHFTSVNGLSPFRCQAVTWSTPGSLSDEPLPINFCDTCINIDYVIKKTNLKILPAKLEPLCFGLNVLTNTDFTRQHMCIQWLQFSTVLSFYLCMSLSVWNKETCVFMPVCEMGLKIQCVVYIMARNESEHCTGCQDSFV